MKGEEKRGVGKCPFEQGAKITSLSLYVSDISQSVEMFRHQ